jgi:D-arabinose 1-dehydrogenase-like Zn-dependent alcohol dehydrogenase
VIGVGGVGQSVIQVAKHAGAFVIALVRGAARADVAAKIGANAVINSREGNVTRTVRAATDGAGVDVVIDNVGSNESLLEAFSSLKPGGRIVMIGESDDAIPISTFRLCVNEFEIIGSRSGGREDTVEAIRLVEREIVTPYVSDTYSLDKINEAFDSIRHGKVMGRAVIKME